MIAYKGFNKNLACTMGKGTYQYKVGKTYYEKKAKTASTGFHCVEEPIEVLRWYSGPSARYCMVEAGGDINESGNKISCTKMKIIKELTIQELGAHEALWILNHPERENSSYVSRDEATAENSLAVVRGKRPRARGKVGDTLVLIQEETGSRQIKKIGIYEVDGKKVLPDVWYTTLGRRTKEREKRNFAKT